MVLAAVFQFTTHQFKIFTPGLAFERAGMIEKARLFLQQIQIMFSRKHILLLVILPGVYGDALLIAIQLDTIDKRLEDHRMMRPTHRNTIFD